VVLCKGGAGGAAGLRATAVSCGIARNMMSHWENKRACASGGSGGRGSCSVGGYRCQAVKVDRGISVSCARKGADIAFIAEG